MYVNLETCEKTYFELMYLMLYNMLYHATLYREIKEDLTIIISIYI